MERKKLIITGHARTGTTALSGLLNIDGRLFITPECHQFLPEMNAQNIYINTTAKSNVLRMDKMFERHNLTWSDLWPENAKRSKFNQWLHKNLPKSVEYIGDKTPRPYLQNIKQIIQKSEYDISIIICIRDGRDCVISKFWGDSAHPHPMKTQDHNLNKVFDTGRNKIVESWISSMKIIQEFIS